MKRENGSEIINLTRERSRRRIRAIAEPIANYFTDNDVSRRSARIALRVTHTLTLGSAVTGLGLIGAAVLLPHAPGISSEAIVGDILFTFGSIAELGRAAVGKAITKPFDPLDTL